MTANPWGRYGRPKPAAPVATQWEYWERPSAGCLECKVEFSDVVGKLHSQRTGHTVVVVPDVVRRAA